MPSKPTLNDARWAELVDGTPAANLAAPTEGKKDTGFGATAEALAGSLLNYVFRQAYRWFAYLDAPDALKAEQEATDPPALWGTNTLGTGVRGDTEADDVEKAGVKGTSSGDSPAVLAITTGGGLALKVEGPADFDDDVDAAGAATLGSTLAVTGLASLNGGLAVTRSGAPAITITDGSGNARGDIRMALRTAAPSAPADGDLWILDDSAGSGNVFLYVWIAGSYRRVQLTT